MSELMFETRGPVAHLTLNRPEAFNALNAPLRAALREAQSRLQDDPVVRVVILSGAGRGFCSGTDLTERHPESSAQFLDREYRPILNAISHAPQIWIAQVHGTAAGIGAALAMNCDMVTMADDASIYMAFAAIGLIPDGGSTWLLHRGLGYKRALQAIVEGRRIPAAEAVELGLANAAHPGDALAAGTQAMAERIAAGAPLAAAAAKRLLRAADTMSYDAAMSAEGVEQSRLTVSADAREGIAAFLGKRKPEFRGA